MCDCDLGGAALGCSRSTHLESICTSRAPAAGYAPLTATPNQVLTPRPSAPPQAAPDAPAFLVG